MDLSEYFKKFGKRSNKCADCGKSYKLPSFIYHPREEICASCESKQMKINVLTGAINILKGQDE